MQTMTEPKASPNTCKNTPLIFICPAECEWPWPLLFTFGGGWGGGDGYVSSFSLSSVKANWVRRLRECDKPPACECPWSPPCSKITCWLLFNEHQTTHNLPWKRNNPIRFTSKPIAPTTINSCGSWIVSTSMNLLHASTVIEKHRATKNTALTRAPRTSALAQPKVFLDHFLGDIYVYRSFN